MSTLPWDELQPDEEIPPVPVFPRPPVPGPRPPIDWDESQRPLPDIEIPKGPPSDVDPDVKDLAKDLLAEVVSYIKGSLTEIGKGQTVDVLNPTITIEDVSGRELVVADAKSRSWRTLVQGLIFDVFAAIIIAVATLTGADPLAKETWVGFGVLLLKSVVSAVISYFMRLRVTPTIKIPGEEMAVMPIPRQLKEEDK